MSITHKVVLAIPFVKNEYESTASFRMAYMHFEDDHLEVSLRPDGIPFMQIYPAGAAGIVDAKGVIVLGSTATTRVANLIQSLEDAIKANLEFAWPESPSK